jgi:hypothetical protein
MSWLRGFESNLQECCYYTSVMSRNSSVSMRAGWQGIRVPFPSGERDFSLIHWVKTGSGSHPAFCPVDDWNFSHEDKWARAWSLLLTYMSCEGPECVEIYLKKLHALVHSIGTSLPSTYEPSACQFSMGHHFCHALQLLCYEWRAG